MSKQTAPHWCPEAVATARGWENKETGELYVSDTSLVLEVKVTKPKVEKVSKKTAFFSNN
jgi:hypothetical protein